MYQKIRCSDISDLDFDMDLFDPTLGAFTPSTMIQMEKTLLSLDGTNDNDSDSDSFMTDDSNSDWCTSATTVALPHKKQRLTSNAKPRQLPGPKSSRRIEDMTPEEISRRQRRRERNKAAATRCRQRRLDLTNQLLTETQQLEAEGQRLEQEIENLRKQRDQLEFVLESHKPMCQGDSINVHLEPVGSGAVMMPAAVRPCSLPVTTSNPFSLSMLNFDLGSTGLTPVVSASGLNMFMGADFLSPTTLLGSPTTFSL